MTIGEGAVSITDNLISGNNCSECEAIVCKTFPFAIVATAADVQVIPLAAHLGLESTTKTANTVVPEHKVVRMQLSPLERYLVVYRTQNPNAPTQDGGNMAVYRLHLDEATAPKVQLVMRCVQSSWPAFIFTQDETYAVRYVRGLLVLHDVAKDFIACGDAAVEDADEGGAEESDDDEEGEEKKTAAPAAAPKRALCNLNAGVAKGKELVMSLPTVGVKSDSSSGNTLAVFRPFTNNSKKRGGAVGGGVNPGAASLVLYRLPQMLNPGLMAVPLHQAEDVALEWSPDGGNYLCVWIKLDSSAAGGGGGSDYYGKTFLYLIDVRLKKEMLIKFPIGGGPPTSVVSPGFSALTGSQPVHDVKWCPSPSFYKDCAASTNHATKSASQLFVAIHGEMPHSEATLFNEKGQALYRFGKTPCNIAHWSPNGAFVALGGFGNLSGDVRICYNGEAVAQYYHNKSSAATKKGGGGGNNRKGLSSSSSEAVSALVGTLSDKTSEQSWSPDSRLYLTSTLFGKLRTSNKVVLYKHTGEKIYERKYNAAPILNNNPHLAPTIADEAMLFQASWLPTSYTMVDDEDSEDVLNLVSSSPASFPPASPRMPVSYTHLRAHETPEHLVCRLLLEKKKKKKKNNKKSNIC
eukprot:TRINITY_DN16461_c0_g1_i1.p1 TRINITY_DN16461_c0_g1~~TRINITY_DN16461_c0_g1_i1.p1  ORF type:complete len:634 (-),score=203.42 TRINITY_DN16461_c0_g1_i1:72-1973(-)